MRAWLYCSSNPWDVNRCPVLPSRRAVVCGPAAGLPGQGALLRTVVPVSGGIPTGNAGMPE